MANSILKYFLLQTRFWELAVGSLIVFLPKQNKSEMYTWIGLTFILTAAVTFTEAMPNPSHFTLFPTIGAALVILYSEETFVSRVLSHRIPVLVGLISYSAYLIHQPLLAFARIRANRFLDPQVSIFLIAVSLCSAYLTWRFVENPFRDRKRIRISVILVLFVTLFCAGMLTSNSHLIPSKLISAIKSPNNIPTNNQATREAKKKLPFNATRKFVAT
jgi:peptidoglycan/LPS O-acetylase OafA/YrhL